MKHTTHSYLYRFAHTVLFTVAAASMARADYPSLVQSHNPIAYWQLNETAASPPLNILTNYGSVGSAGNGVVVRQITKGQPGKVGNAILLANGGAGSIACYSKVDVPFTAALNPHAPFSVEIWANPSRNDQTLCAISSMDCQQNGGGSRLGWLIYENATVNWQFRMGLSSGYAIILSSSSAPQVGTWQHIVATFDGTTAKIYINGVLSNSGTPLPGWVPNTQMPLMIGALGLAGGGGNTIDGPAPSFGGIAGYRGFEGLLDEAAVYPTVLSAAQVLAHFNAAATPATYSATILADNPLGYWTCNDPAVVPPAASSLPIAANAGTLGSAVDGTNSWGSLAAQSGPGYAGMGGASDKAVFFDGDNGYVGLKDDPGMHFSGNITMMAWVKPMGSINYYRNIIGHGWDQNYRETFLRISQGDDGSGGAAGNFYETGISLDGSVAGYDDNVARFPIPAGDVGNWVLVAGTYDGTGWNLYRNGQLVAQTLTENGAVDVTNRWSIGSRSGPSPTVGLGSATFESEGLFFDGFIDEPAIFTTALSGADILALYNAAQVPPVITRAPVNPGTVAKGSTVSFSVWAEGGGTLGYLWTSNGISTGVTTTNYTISNIPIGTYTIAVIVTNAYGTATPSVTFNAVALPPAIVTGPSSETRFAGFPFNFAVTASGSQPLSYFWYLGNTLVGTSSSYGGTASAGNAGTYKVVVSNETLISVTSAPVVLTVYPTPAGYGSAVLASSPIAYWRLDESSGTIAHDGINGYDGTFNNATLGVPGYSAIDSDTAVSFNGINSYVGAINGTAINFPGHSTFSLEAWVNAPPQSDDATIIAKGIGPNNTTRTEQFGLDVAAGVYRFFTTRGNTVYEVDASVGPNNTWQHIVAVYDDQNINSAGSNMFIYVNGELHNSSATRPDGVTSSTYPVSIGSKHGGNEIEFDDTFNGTIDEVAVYNYPLTPATVQNHYAAAYGSNLKPFISIQPSSVTNYIGLPAKLSVVAAGTVPLTYQWRKHGTDIPGESGSALAFNPLSAGDSDTYSVFIQNSVGSTQSATVSVTVLAAPTNPPDISGLVLHLPFENSLADTSGRGNNGTGMHSTSTTTNAATPSPANPDFQFVSDGALGSALHYHTVAYLETNNVAYATNTFYVSLGVRPDLKFGSNSFTLAFWIRTDLGYNGGDLPFFTDGIGSEGAAGYVFAPAYGYGTASPNPTPPPQNFGGWGLTIYDAAAANGIRLYGDLGSISDHNWHHLVHVVDRSAGSVTTYLDGAVAHYSKAAGNTVNAAGDIDTTHPTIIGQDPTGLYPEEGEFEIDDLGVWRKALSPLEAASIYAAAKFNNLSFTNTASTLNIQSIGGGKIVVTWPLGNLQAAPNVTGPYTNVPSASSPWTNSATSGSTFYRTKL